MHPTVTQTPQVDEPRERSEIDNACDGGYRVGPTAEQQRAAKNVESDESVILEEVPQDTMNHICERAKDNDVRYYLIRVKSSDDVSKSEKKI